MSGLNFQPFNVYAAGQGVFPPVARVQVRLPEQSDSYHLMTSKEAGPKAINFWHAVCHPETVVTLDGEYDITLGNQRLTQQKGDVLVIPAGMLHGRVETRDGYHNLQIENTHPGCQNLPRKISEII